jgi:glutamate-1-semialdehyde 2,1-aminomutase
MIPSAERVRFTASGTEATLLALRVARAYTGRQKVVRFEGHFHGWHDEAMAHDYNPAEAGLNAAAVDTVGVASPVNVDQVLGWIAAGDVAGVILEPGGGRFGALPFSRPFLQALRDATQQHGALLIFDEIMSGFRQSAGGVQKETGIIPDVTTLGKILAGGLPGGAVVGRADIMAVFGDGVQRDDRHAQVPHTGTFNANPLSAVAGIAMLEHIQDGMAHQKAKAAAEHLVDRLNALARKHQVDIFYYTNGSSIYHILIGARKDGMPLAPSLTVGAFYRARPRHYALLRRALLVEGVDAHPLHGWVSAAHDDQVIDETLHAYDRAFRRIRDVDGFQRR